LLYQLSHSGSTPNSGKCKSIPEPRHSNETLGS
jgi:hypothetical protein